MPIMPSYALLSILTILTWATPALAGPTRKRLFKIYSPHQVREKDHRDGRRSLKGAKQPKLLPSLSMSMKHTKSEKKSSKSKSVPTSSPSPTNTPTANITTAPDENFSTVPSVSFVPSVTKTAPPSPSPVRVMTQADATTPPTLSNTPTSYPTMARVPVQTNQPTTSPTPPPTVAGDEETAEPTASPVDPPAPATSAAMVSAAKQDSTNGSVTLEITLSGFAMLCVMVLV